MKVTIRPYEESTNPSSDGSSRNFVDLVVQFKEIYHYKGNYSTVFVIYCVMILLSIYSLVLYYLVDYICYPSIVVDVHNEVLDLENSSPISNF